eukprot:TRINITY_DN5651_c0_g3_i1.p1 TRINITY_DN5651_c0_g3~~TRINITY_DN5651_c0_g3_i1.p1  ORF type:complete len:384 (-),score=94.27 TRINITY_DN5651_c0_g3_i1:63-1214(-)
MALKGVRVLELAGLAPAPFCGMVLADFGADVIRVDRVGASNMDKLARGKRSIAIDLKKDEGRQLLLRLIERADVLIEPFRPGVMEKMGLGPEFVCNHNPRLIYARMTGFGQTGPYAPMAGHDINYIALTGALSITGRKDETPTFAGNLLGDFAGGGMLCAMGILLALIERSKSGRGQVVDAAMVDGATYLMSFIFKAYQNGMWADEKGTSLLDGGAHFYDTYRTKDGKFMSVGAIEPQFYKLLLKGMGLDPATLPDQMSTDHWPEMKQKFAAVFASKTRDEWCKIFDGTDACVAPVLQMGEIMKHPHNVSRAAMFVGSEEELEPAAAPRLSRTPGTTSAKPQPEVGQHTVAVLMEYGVSGKEVCDYARSGVIDAPESAGHAKM